MQPANGVSAGMSRAPGHHHHDGHTHAHATDEPVVQPVASQLPSSSERRTRLVALITAAAMVVEIAAGWWFNSMALLADGWHMGTHAAAIGLSALAYALARRYRTDPRFAFGTWKIEVLAGFVSALAWIFHE